VKGAFKFVVLTGVGSVVAVLLAEASNAARGRVELTLPSWSEEDEKAFVEPASFLLGGGLLPGTGKPEDAEGGSQVAATGEPAVGEDGEGGAGPWMEGVAVLAGALAYGPELGPEGPIEPVVLVRVAPDIPLPPVRVDVPREYVDGYIGGPPKGTLVDPQLLLTEFKKYDIDGFLQYHEEESPYRICMMLFERDQELPDGATLRSLHEEWYGDEPVALLAYFMGQPERAVVEFGRLARDGLSGSYLASAVESCAEEGLIVENAFNQLERFGMELSVQLYWLEKELGLEPPMPARVEERMAEAAVVAGESRWDELVDFVGTLPRWYLVGGGSLLLGVFAGGVVLFGYRRMAGRNGHLFPDYEIDARLGGAHSGGGHGVLSFGRARGR
jgi:hypothetical protein